MVERRGSDGGRFCIRVETALSKGGRIFVRHGLDGRLREKCGRGNQRSRPENIGSERGGFKNFCRGIGRAGTVFPVADVFPDILPRERKILHDVGGGQLRNESRNIFVERSIRIGKLCSGHGEHSAEEK